MSKKVGLTLKKASTVKDLPKPVSSEFQYDSDDEPKPTSKSELFDIKYGNIKAKDQRIIEKVLEEDPTAYEYDSVYEESQRQKNEKTEEQRKADVEKKPKYADKIITAHKKRELEKLLHDENTYKKERAKEAGEFEDKEVYVTGAYRKQIEERNQFREEIEKDDALDSLVNVKDQGLWQQAFNRNLLESRTRKSAAEEKAIDTLSEIKTELKTEAEEKISTTTAEAKAKPAQIKSIYSSDEEEKPEKEKTPPARFDELKPGLNVPKLKEEKRTEERRRSDHETSDRHHGRNRSDKRRSRYSREISNGKSMSPGPADKGNLRERKPDYMPKLDDTEDEFVRRMKRIREIMRRRATDEDIAEARKRYFQRKAEGIVVPPV
ncbi:coiled-coil domain-containing protein 55 domain-containing protein [Ditylenchus destructor]|nr:coiled-coil domain-containing protein 55 domain-containing protein [Ditylenchus destructor]